MMPSDRIVLSQQSGNLKHKVDPQFAPTPWTEFILSELKNFSKYHGISLLFLLILFSLYMNSFVRGGIVILFCMAPSGLFYLVRLVIPGAFHADSLWLFHLVPWAGTFVLLTIARIVDIERTRGYDRDSSIEEVRTEFSSSVALAALFLAAIMLLLGLAEAFPYFPTLGFWKEGVFLSVLTSATIFLAIRFLFPLFYLTSEEMIESILLRIFRIISLKGLLRK